MSVRFAVLFREGRGGGEVGVREEAIPLALRLRLKECNRGSSFCLAKGSCSGILGEGVAAEVCLSERGFGFWRELRTLEEVVGGEDGGSAVGVLERTEGGGGGAAREGAKGEYLAASAACKFASARRAEYSWMDSLDGR